MKQKHYSTHIFKMCQAFMPWLAEFVVPNYTFVEQKVNSFYTFRDHENKHDFPFGVQMKQKIVNREKALQSQ